MSSLSYDVLLIGMILAMTSFRFILAAYQGLIALVGQEELMSGHLSTLGRILFPGCAHPSSLRFRSHQREPVAPSDVLLMAVFASSIGVFGLWKARSVLGHAYDRPLARHTDLKGDVRGC